jgi:hypothetical protein
VGAWVCVKFLTSAFEKHIIVRHQLCLKHCCVFTVGMNWAAVRLAHIELVAHMQIDVDTPVLSTCNRLLHACQQWMVLLSWHSQPCRFWVCMGDRAQAVLASWDLAAFSCL